MMWKLIYDLLTNPQPRQKLPDINTLDQVLDLLKSCRNILVLTGAGVSKSNIVCKHASVWYLCNQD